jgi:hypothetical protein
VIGVGWQSPLEEVNAQVFFAFAFRVPQDGGLDGLNVGGVHGVDLIFADQLLARGKLAAEADDA